MPEVSLAQWNHFIAENLDAHFLQTGEWGELKSRFGWEAVRLISEGVGAQVLIRKLRLGLSFAYIPKGQAPGSVSPDSRALWMEADILCRKRGVILCKVEPDEWVSGSASPDGEAPVDKAGAMRLLVSPHNIQPRRTIIVDLRPGEDEILERMKPKCRYNIRLAERKGVTVQVSSDLAAFHNMMQATGKRDAFSVHSFEYYRRAYELFHAAGMCQLFAASFAGRTLAGLMVLAHGRRAWYVYGGSTDEERSRMPNYLLQWEAMRWAKARGCQEYDLWGVPDFDEQMLEANFEKQQTGLWGVYRFKRGFGGEVKRAAQAMDRVYRPWLYRLYLRRFSAQDGI